MPSEPAILEEVDLKSTSENEEEEEEKGKNESKQQQSHPTKKLEKKRSSFSLTPKPLRHYLTREVLPHMDHYRNRLSFHRGTYYACCSIITQYITLWACHLY